MKENKKWYIVIGDERVEVSEEVYHAYWHYTEKERYFMVKLKQEKFVSSQEEETATFFPSREDSFERLQERGISFPDTTTPTPDRGIDRSELYAILYRAISTLSNEEVQLIQELFYLEKTEREVAELLHTAASTINYRKKRVLAKLKKLLEKSL